MRQPKKIFTRMLMNNWGGINHQVIAFHEHVNLFSGKSGSGKSTVMDAMQVVLYGSVRNDFLNKAADDTKNKRSVLSYLRGEQKDGSANRENQDFYSHIILEIQDTGSGDSVCIGAAFEVARGDQDLKKFFFFSHVGKFPEDEYLSDKGMPYSDKELQGLINGRGLSGENKGRINLNRTYPSQDAYLNILNDVIFGYVDAGRFKTMQKSAIALRMTNGTGQFIKDYMFPKSKEDTISAISEQLAAYREIKEQVETIEKKIDMLDEIQRHDRALTQARADQVITEAFLKILEIEDKKAHLEAREADLANVEKAISELEAQAEELKQRLKDKRDELSQVQVELKASEFQGKKDKLRQLEELMRSCGNEASDWRELVRRLGRWENAEGVSDSVSNSVRHMLEELRGGDITREKVERLKHGLNEIFDSLTEELNDLKDERRVLSREQQEKNDILTDLKSDKKHYRKELKELKRRLQEELSDRHSGTVHVEILADLFDVTDEDWRNAIEGRLGRIKFGLVVEPQYAIEAAKIFRQIKKPEYESVDLINTAAILRDKPEAGQGTLYDAVTTENRYVDLCLKRYLGHIRKCDTVEELHEVKDGVTKDCYSYSNYMFRHLRQQDYRYPSIGKKISKKQIQELEDELDRLDEQLGRLEKEIVTLMQVNDFERLKDYGYDRLCRLSSAEGKLKKYTAEAQRLQEEIRELENGTYIAGLQQRESLLAGEIDELDQRKDGVQKDNIRQAGRRGELDREIRDRKENLEKLQEGFSPNHELQEQVVEAIGKGKASDLRKEKTDALEKLKMTEMEEQNSRGGARMKFIKAFPACDFGGMEKENTVYDELLERCRSNYEPEYKAEFDKQYHLVYRMLRENVIATIHGEIRSAKRHRREINAMLAKIRFADSIYQIDILPVDDENRQFYDMLTAEELDMKAPTGGMGGQFSFGEDEFYRKYEAQIGRLTEKFMPPRDAGQDGEGTHKKKMEKYADYRTYLKFSMYEQAEDADGNVKKNYVDDMAGRDSGGEGQNPKYVALLAGFAMLYMQQGNRDSKIRLVLLDEAFSKMDKERSEVCLHYARQLGLQLVVCVPDERLQSLIRNVDCVYAFRRVRNRISMMYIDKGKYFRMIEGDTDEEGIVAGPSAD